jgi:hypothetical protein
MRVVFIRDIGLSRLWLLPEDQQRLSPWPKCDSREECVNALLWVHSLMDPHRETLDREQ